MALLSRTKSPIAEAQAALAALQARQTVNNERLGAARRAHSNALARQKELLSTENFNTDQLAGENTKVQQAASIISGLESLGREMASAIAGAAKRLAYLRDQAERAVAAEKIVASITGIEGALAAYEKASLDLAAAVAGKFGPTLIEGPRLGAGVKQTADGIDAQVSNVLSRLRAARVNVLDGEGAAPVQPGPALESTSPPPAIERKKIYAVERLKWTEGSTVVEANRHRIASLPVAVAQFVLTHGLGHEPDSERHGSLQRVGAVTEGPGQVVDLDQWMKAVAR